jgi:arginyl-tRNA synthetase
MVVKGLYPEQPLPHFEVAPSEHFADYASNIAMILASTSEENPRQIATKIQDALLGRQTFTEAVADIEIAGPGFLNFNLKDTLLIEGLAELKGSLQDGFTFLSGVKTNVEFISANPTGKLHIGHGRGAFFGDVFSNILSFSGAYVTREFYINNSRESNQINELGKTALGTGEQYKTPALEEKIAKLKTDGLSEQEAGFLLAEQVQEENKNTIEKEFGISFDTYYSEDEQLRVGKKIEVMKEKLTSAGNTYEKDGALWLKTSEFGDDEDRVIVRSDGKASYFLGDIAYHDDKFSRGLDSVFNVWGADHQGHVKRMQAVKKMLQWQGNFHIFIAQLVMLKSAEGERVKMSKRAGNVVLLEDLVSEIDIDVARWFFLEKTLNTQMDFNLTLAKERSEKNPVRYVQYAHARMCSIIEKAGKEKKETDFANVLKDPSARLLARKLVEFPEVIEEITKDFMVSKLTTYTYSLSKVFSQFYHDVRVLKEDGSIDSEALALVQRSEATLECALSLLGISAPEKM